MNTTILLTSPADGEPGFWSEENTRILLEAAAGGPEPDERVLRRLERRLAEVARFRSAPREWVVPTWLKALAVGYLAVLIGSALLGEQFRFVTAVNPPPPAAATYYYNYDPHGTPAAATYYDNYDPHGVRSAYRGIPR